MDKTKVIMTLITVGLIALVVIVSLTGNRNDDENVVVVFEEGVVNIYYFYIDGCPNCDAQFEFFERIEDEWGAYFNLYSYEVQYNSQNAELLSKLAEILDETVGGIPFTIIGEKAFVGFNERMEDNFIDAIREGANQDFDVYRYLND